MFNLHLGGKIPHPDWKILNAVPGSNVDYVSNAVSLELFEDNSVDKLYASHILEHLDYREARTGLSEWYRVLKEGGEIMIAVPDLKKLSKLILRNDLSVNDIRKVTAMFYGGQIDEYDYHKAGYSLETLADLLLSIGFKDIIKVESFGIFQDTSVMVFMGEPISLNVVARK